MVPNTPHESIKVQAKRLRDLFSIDLTTAKYVLARGPYGCADWSDLCARLSEELPLQNALQLAELPQSSIAAAYLAKHLRRLASSVSQLILTNRNLPELCEALRQVFAVPGNPVTLADVLQPITPTAWQSTALSPDPLAVIQSRVCINGVELQLIGTRIFWPRLFTFDAEITVVARTAEPVGDDLKIMWEVAPWYQASRNYLLEYQRGDDWDDLPEFAEPHIAESPRMSQHRRWLAQCLKCWSQECHYNDEGEEFIPFLYQDHAYLVFGVPCSEQATSSLRRQYVQFSKDDSHCYQVILFDGQLVQIEKLTPPNSSDRHEWEYADYHQALCHRLLRGAAAAGWTTAPTSGWDDLLCISPANHFSLECELRVEIKPEPDETLCTLQTDNQDLAVEVLERVSKGRFIQYEHAELGDSYAMRIDLPPQSARADLSLSLDFIEETVFQSAHLIGRRVTHTDEHGSALYLELKPALLKLVQRQSLKVLKKALCEGQILRVQGLPEQLKEAPVVPPDASAREPSDTWESNPLAEPLFDGEGQLLFRATHYQRDNF
ncbi:hypothetical protein [Pseudomonas sp. M5]|uniref:hypothetical protein n=1 Tax=Pseudomonas sp. M5 TaxID=1620788 RepID=UPI0019588EC5|nr:hypothetical protein [Pseudomonas sp. M5]MBM7396794.1 hypothetical protein [Pseudomonas sp. M5]HDS1756049.1 hypothetical protein [Pseudomonas putida]